MKIQRDNLRIFFFFSLSPFFMVGEDEAQEKRGDKIITKKTHATEREREWEYIRIRRLSPPTSLLLSFLSLLCPLFRRGILQIRWKDNTEKSNTHAQKPETLLSLSLCVTHTRSNYLMYYYYYCCWCCCYSFFPPFPSYPKWDLITLAHSLLLRCWRLREEERKKIYKIKDSRPSSSVTETHNIV